MNRIKLAAAVSVALGAAGIAALSFGLANADAPAPELPAPTRALARDVLQHLIAINSTHAHGSSAAAHYVADQLRAAGFPDNDVRLLTPSEHPTKGNVIVRLHGRGGVKPLLYICHLDVVEARREDWSFDPFVLTERDGWLYGRGTSDMKGQGTAVLATLIRLKKEGYVPDRDIIVAFTADEEAGGDANGVDWLMKNHKDLVDAEFVINPDSGDAASDHGKPLFLGIQTAEKQYMTFGWEATDKGGHSSQPTPANP